MILRLLPSRSPLLQRGRGADVGVRYGLVTAGGKASRRAVCRHRWLMRIRGCRSRLGFRWISRVPGQKKETGTPFRYADPPSTAAPALRFIPSRNQRGAEAFGRISTTFSAYSVSTPSTFLST